jgi:hypothetical protein
MTSIPLDLERRFERRWAARFAQQASESSSEKSEYVGQRLGVPGKAKGKPARLSLRARGLHEPCEREAGARGCPPSPLTSIALRSSFTTSSSPTISRITS